MQTKLTVTSRAGVVSLLLLTVFPMAGCNSNDQKTAAALVQTMGTAVTSLLTLEGNAALAPRLQKDFQAASTAVANWKQGTPAQDVVEALNLLDSDLDLVPVSDKDKALIELAIGTVDEILALLPATATSPAAAPAAVAPAMFVQNGARAMRVEWPTKRPPHVRRRLVRPIWGAKDFKKQWNELITKRPELTKAKAK
ncbi:MAG TPA: hypothetical protein VGN16_15205 [Acidobacteriaceae bacterium]|jgi:hypothetical protein